MCWCNSACVCDVILRKQSVGLEVNMGAWLSCSIILIHQIWEELWAKTHSILTDVLIIGSCLVPLEEYGESWVSIESLRAEELEMVAMDHFLFLIRILC